MCVFPGTATAQPEAPHHRQRVRVWSVLAMFGTRVIVAMRLMLSQRKRHREVDACLRELEAAIDYHACPDILALTASIAAYVNKPIEIQPWPFPGEIAGMVVGTPTKYAIKYSILAHPMLQLVAICHELGHILLGDVTVIDGQATVLTKMRWCGDISDGALPIPDDSASTLSATVPEHAPHVAEDQVSYDPIAEEQAERFGALLRKHWEAACPIRESDHVPSLSAVPQDHQAWVRYQTYFSPLD